MLQSLGAETPSYATANVAMIAANDINHRCHASVLSFYGSETFRMPLLFSGSRRLVYVARRAAGRRAKLLYVATGVDFNMSTNLEIRQQQSFIQFKIRNNKMTQDVNSVFPPDQPVFIF